jgi:deoxyuridine 5'-triphosphate nucleotidohydrolase
MTYNEFKEQDTIIVNAILHNTNQLPLIKAYMEDSSYDITSNERVTIDPGSISTIQTSIILEMPKTIDAEIRTRASLAISHGIVVLNSPGTVDSSYKGRIIVVLANFGKCPYTILPGKRIAHLVFRFKPNVRIENHIKKFRPSSSYYTGHQNVLEDFAFDSSESDSSSDDGY